MGCEYYHGLHFSEIDDTVDCLCTFPENDKIEYEYKLSNELGYTDGRLSGERIRSLAYLGAAIVLAQKGELRHNVIPDCLPRWIKIEIDRHIIT